MLETKSTTPGRFFHDGFEGAAGAVPGPGDAHRVLSKLGYGPRGGDVAAFEALPGTPAQKLAAWLDTQLDPGAIDDSDCDARIAAGGFTTLAKSRTQLYADHVRDRDNLGLNDHPFRYYPVAETECARLIRAVHSRRQLFERTVEFWHDHFNVLGWEFNIAPMFVQYDRDVIRANAFGNFRAMLEEVAKSNAMMLFLDNKSSRGAAFNENFARELCELHTLGAENYAGVVDPESIPTDPDGVALQYCDEDVYEVARCFTGWTLADGHWEFPSQDSGEFLYFSSWHDRAGKILLGKRFRADQLAMEDGRDALDLLCAHAGTARHICGKLIRRFIGDTPTPALLASAAALWQQEWQSADQIAQVLRLILGSDEVFSRWGDKRKRPFESLVQALRACDAEVAPTPYPDWSPYGEMNSLLQQAGHGMFRWPTPDGYPEAAEKWQAVGVLAQSWRMLSNLPEWRAPADGNPPFLAPIHALTLAALPNAPSRTATAIVDFWLQRVLGYVPQDARRTQLIDFMRQSAAASAPLDLVTDSTDSNGVPRHTGTWAGNDLSRHHVIARLRATVALIFCLPDFYQR